MLLYSMVMFNRQLNLLVKLHPLMLEGKTNWESAGIDWSNKLNQLNQNRNIHICNQAHLERYMFASDVLITDVSSVGIEYMFLSKPVIFLPAPKFFNHFGEDKPIFWIRKGLEISDIIELREQLNTLLSKPKYRPDYDIRKISFNPGATIESMEKWMKKLCCHK